jgi:hypothetical protein
MTRTHLRGSWRPGPTASPFPPVAALLGVGALLLGTCPAMAQSISVTSGTATVSGTGTAVTGSGTTFGGGAGPNTSSYMTGTVAGVNTVLNLQDGGSIQSITTGTGSPAINISGGTAGTISVNGGLNAVQTSITISGGTVTTVNSDRAGVGISGGTIQSVNSGFNGIGTITVSGGNIQKLSAQGNLTINGGTLGSVTTNGFSFSNGVTVTAGTIQALSLLNPGNNSISGGNISSLTNSSGGASISGGSFQSISNRGPLSISGGSFQFITNYNTLNIMGTNLQEIGTPTDANNDGVFQILGTLSDGETLNAQYTQNSGVLEFNGVPATPSPVPEASTAAALGGLLLLGGAGLAVRARKRAKA